MSRRTKMARAGFAFAAFGLADAGSASRASRLAPAAKRQIMMGPFPRCPGRRGNRPRAALFPPFQRLRACDTANWFRRTHPHGPRLPARARLRALGSAGAHFLSPVGGESAVFQIDNARPPTARLKKSRWRTRRHYGIAHISPGPFGRRTNRPLPLPGASAPRCRVARRRRDPAHQIFPNKVARTVGPDRDNRAPSSRTARDLNPSDQRRRRRSCCFDSRPRIFNSSRARGRVVALSCRPPTIATSFRRSSSIGSTPLLTSRPCRHAR